MKHGTSNFLEKFHSSQSSVKFILKYVQMIFKWSSTVNGNQDGNILFSYDGNVKELESLSCTCRFSNLSRTVIIHNWWTSLKGLHMNLRDRYKVAICKLGYEMQWTKYPCIFHQCALLMKYHRIAYCVNEICLLEKLCSYWSNVKNSVSFPLQTKSNIRKYITAYINLSV